MKISFNPYCFVVLCFPLLAFSQDSNNTYKTIYDDFTEAVESIKIFKYCKSNLQVRDLMQGIKNDTFYIETLRSPLEDCVSFKVNGVKILIDKNTVKDTVRDLLIKYKTDKKTTKYLKKIVQSNFLTEINLLDSVYSSNFKRQVKANYYWANLVSFHLEKGDCQIFYNRTPIYSIKVYGFIESPGYFTKVGSVFKTVDNIIVYENTEYFSIDETVKH